MDDLDKMVNPLFIAGAVAGAIIVGKLALNFIDWIFKNSKYFNPGQKPQSSAPPQDNAQITAHYQTIIEMMEKMTSKINDLDHKCERFTSKVDDVTTKSDKLQDRVGQILELSGQLKTIKEDVESILRDGRVNGDKLEDLFRNMRRINNSIDSFTDSLDQLCNHVIKIDRTVKNMQELE